MSTKTSKKSRPGLRTSPGELLSQAVSKAVGTDEQAAPSIFANPDVVFRQEEPAPRPPSPAVPEASKAAPSRDHARQRPEPEEEKETDRDTDDRAPYDEGDDEVYPERERPALAPAKKRRLRRYKPLPRDEDEVYRPYSVSLSDRQYEYIAHIRVSEMLRLNRNVSVAQVIRTLIEIGLENAEGTKIFDSRPRRRLD